jgi:hypothetical protein
LSRDDLHRRTHQHTVVDVQAMQRPVHLWGDEVQQVVTRGEGSGGVDDVLVYTLSEEDRVGEAHRQGDTAREEGGSRRERL